MQKIFISDRERFGMYDPFGNFMLASSLVPLIDQRAGYTTELIKAERDLTKFGINFYVKKFKPELMKGEE